MPDSIRRVGECQEGCCVGFTIVVWTLVREGTMWGYPDQWMRSLKECVKEKRKGSKMDRACLVLQYGTNVRVLGGA